MQEFLAAFAFDPLLRISWAEQSAALGWAVAGFVCESVPACPSDAIGASATLPDGFSDLLV